MTKKLTGYHLKLIALITMLIDHVAAVFIWRVYLASFHLTGSLQLSEALGDKIIVWVAGHQELVYSLYENMRLIGRMSFPIYCFLLVEGFLHTRSVGKYGLRLLAFAALSEIPFDLALTGQAIDMDYSNVFFTLVIGLMAIWSISYIEKFAEFWKEKQWDTFLGILVVAMSWLLVVTACGGFAEIVLKTDYGFAGVIAIVVMYLFRRTKEIGFVAGIFLLTILSSDTEILALFMLYPLMKYDGTRGKSMKYVFYAFYPLHLLLLAFACMLIGV
ncbi:MAG: conjugal transfer protein TraX [Agathobacter sp.]|nr:conjugal transfer protein TraX [Agathobacter sp.]